MSVAKETDSIRELKPPPVVACKLMELYYADYHNEQIVGIIQIDPALTVKILSVCNSAYYGGREEIGSLDQAISLLGFGKLINLVWKICLGGALQRPLDCYGIPEQGLWQHSVTTAVAAQELCRLHPNPPEPDDVAFTAGLLHDIGKIVVNQALKSDSDKLLELLRKEEHSMTEAERVLQSTDHAQVGGGILEEWNLPSCLVEAVTRHHDPPLDRAALSSIIHLADWCAHTLGASYGYRSLSNRMKMETLDALRFTSKHLEDALVRIQMRAEEIADFASAL